MNKKNCIFLIICCFFVIFCYPIDSSATTTTSNVGIVFTEKEVSEKGGHGKEREHSTETGKQIEEALQNGQERNQFPQTGEKKQGFLILIGVLLLSIAVWLRKREIGSAKYELKKSCVSSFFRKCNFRSNNSCKSSTSR